MSTCQERIDAGENFSVEGPIPIPPLPGLCTSQEALSTFIQVININFELMIHQFCEVFDVDLELPGVPQMSITVPGFDVPGSPANESKFAHHVPPPLGWIGHHVRMRQTGGEKGGIRGDQAVSGLTIPEQTINVGGTDPIFLTMQFVQTNYEIIMNQLEEQGVPIEGFSFGPINATCETDPEELTEILNVNNEEIFNTLVDTGPDVCVPGVDFTQDWLDCGRYVDGDPVGADNITFTPSTLLMTTQNSSGGLECLHTGDGRTAWQDINEGDEVAQVDPLCAFRLGKCRHMLIEHTAAYTGSVSFDWVEVTVGFSIVEEDQTSSTGFRFLGDLPFNGVRAGILGNIAFPGSHQPVASSSGVYQHEFFFTTGPDTVLWVIPHMRAVANDTGATPGPKTATISDIVFRTAAGP